MCLKCDQNATVVPVRQLNVIVIDVVAFYIRSRIERGPFSNRAYRSLFGFSFVNHEIIF